MKKLILVLVITLSTGAFAQSTMKEDVELVQAIYGKSKADLVNQYMALSGTQAQEFSKVYNEYEAERKALGQKKIQIISDYAADYASLTAENADQLTKAALKNNLDYEKLYSKYYEKSKRVIGAINAAKFIQLEVYLQTEIQSEIQNSIPFIGEIDLTKMSRK